MSALRGVDTSDNSTVRDLDAMADSAPAYPIFNLFGKNNQEESPDGTILRNNLYMIAHCGFFLFNFLNVVCIPVFHGFVLRRLAKNFLMKMALLTCAAQLITCLTSIHRYNINDEYGDVAHLSNLTSLVAYSCFNFVMVNLNCIKFRNQKRAIRDVSIGTGTGVWIALAIACWVIGRRDWDTKNFYYFRIYVTACTAYQLITYILVLRAFTTGNISLPNDFPISDAVVTRALVASIVLLLGCAASGMSGMPIFQYPAAGASFSIMVVVVSLVSEMNVVVADDGTGDNNNDKDAQIKTQGRTPLISDETKRPRRRSRSSRSKPTD